jgi:hypothetical protein
MLEKDWVSKLAQRTAAYRSDLIDRGVPDELAALLVRDWHQAELQWRLNEQVNSHERLHNYASMFTSTPGQNRPDPDSKEPTTTSSPSAPSV